MNPSKGTFEDTARITYGVLNLLITVLYGKQKSRDKIGVEADKVYL